MVRYEKMEYRRRREWKEMDERVQLGKSPVVSKGQTTKIKYYPQPFP